jgi:hypothetical protein
VVDARLLTVSVPLLMDMLVVGTVAGGGHGCC